LENISIKAIKIIKIKKEQIKKISLNKLLMVNRKTINLKLNIKYLAKSDRAANSKI